MARNIYHLLGFFGGLNISKMGEKMWKIFHCVPEGQIIKVKIIAQIRKKPSLIVKEHVMGHSSLQRANSQSIVS